LARDRTREATLTNRNVERDGDVAARAAAGHPASAVALDRGDPAARIEARRERIDAILRDELAARRGGRLEIDDLEIARVAIEADRAGPRRALGGPSRAELVARERRAHVAAREGRRRRRSCRYARRRCRRHALAHQIAGGPARSPGDCQDPEHADE